MYDVNSATAIHLELLADIPRKLADKIVAYRKKRKRIFYIDELYRVRGISSKYFERLLSVFYATSQVIPGIGVNIQYNKLSTVTGKQKRQSRDDNLKKRKMKIKKRENQRKIENRDRKRKLQREEIIIGVDSEESLPFSVSVVFCLFTDRSFSFLLLRIMPSFFPKFSGSLLRVTVSSFFRLVLLR
jgi:hypothetical protein